MRRGDGREVHWDEQEAGVDVMERLGTPLPAAVLASVRRTRCALKAPITTPIGKGFRSINVQLRQELGLFACIRPCKYYPGVRTFFSHFPLDLVIVRENTEDLYAGIEFERGKPETAALVDHINNISQRAENRLRPRRDGPVDQADQRVGHGADRPLRLPVRPARTAARRSRPSTRPTS